MNNADLWETPIANAYKLLFNAITDAIEQLKKANLGDAVALLTQAQAAAEDIIIEDELLPL